MICMRPVAMELVSEDGLKKLPVIEKGLKIELGRGLLGYPSDDRTVSRRHISLQLHEHAQKTPKDSYPGGEISAYFQVIGKNPIWIISRGGEEQSVYRNSEEGVLRAGDRFSISLKKPLFFTLKQRDFEAEEEEEEDYDEKRVLEAVERRKKRTLEREEKEQMKVLKDECSLGDCSADDPSIDLGLASFNLSQIDPVKEFGFLVMGQEFKQYPEQKIRHFKSWNWFLEELTEDCEDDQADNKETQGRKTGRNKKKVGEVGEDDDWTGESMDEEVLVAKLRSGKRPKYSTRSKDRKNSPKETSTMKSAYQKATGADEDENAEEDAKDDTLGGFIVNDDELDEEDSGETGIYEEEEEFDDDDEDDGVENCEEDNED